MFLKKIMLCMVACGCLLCAGNAWSAEDFIIGGYWENWSKATDAAKEDDMGVPTYYEHDFANFNTIYYSFLTLAKNPNAQNPEKARWDGKYIYESMTADNIIDVLVPKGNANPLNWQGRKIYAMLEECKAKGKKFIWAIGGWSDLTLTVSDEQVPAFVEQCVELLKVAGDGIDFDWEHLSDNAEARSQQRKVLGKIFPALRKALDDNGMSDKLIGYTTRFNAFWNDENRPSGVSEFPSDGEGLDIAEELAEQGSSLDEIVDWVNIMLYDVPPKDLGSDSHTLATYKMVMDFFEKSVPKEKIVMGFEPGEQAAGGVWEGKAVDKEVLEYIKDNQYGGIMFWAVNHVDGTGTNSQELAGYTKSMAP